MSLKQQLVMAESIQMCQHKVLFLNRIGLRNELMGEQQVSVRLLKIIEVK